MRITISPQMPACITELYYGPGLLEGDLLKSLCNKEGGRVVIITETPLKEYAEQLSKRVGAGVFVIAEATTKSRKTKEVLEDRLLQEHYGRDALLIGLGGGAITDLTGFLASTYLRGVPLLLIPTTLLAMVDAAIGGKNSVDTSRGKNMIGTIYHPRAILADPHVLKTLPHKEFSHGFAEILKMGLIYDASIFQTEELEKLIEKAMRGKIDIIERDPTEKKGLRRILNFGHTIAHGLETVAEGTLPHGEAVAIGCVVESYLSAYLSHLSRKEEEQIRAVFERRFPSLCLPIAYDRRALLEILKSDKKSKGGKIRFVCLDRIGSAVPFGGEYCREVDEKELGIALDYMEKKYGRS